jgi:cytochrome c-type biogenesis protein CcmH/NrfG
MRTILLRVFTLAALLALLATPALAQSVIRGKVTDPQGKPVDGAIITLEAEGAAGKRELKSDKKGEFMQIGLASGTWKITATKQGVGTATTQGRLSQSAPVEVQLTLAPASAAGPTAVAGDAKAQAETNALLTAANAAEAAKNWDDAIAKFSELVAKVPTCAECFRHLGDAQVEKKDFAAAEASYKQSNAVKENAESYMGLVKIYNDQKKFDLAAEASTKMGALAAAAPGGGGSAQANYNTGVALFNGGKFAEAKAAFEAASKADPTMALAHFYLGMASLNGGDLPGATAAFEAYLKLDPDGGQLPASSPLKAADVKAFVASQKK